MNATILESGYHWCRSLLMWDNFSATLLTVKLKGTSNSVPLLHKVNTFFNLFSFSTYGQARDRQTDRRTDRQRPSLHNAPPYGAAA